MEDTSGKYVKLAGIAMGAIGLSVVGYQMLGKSKKATGSAVSSLSLEKTILISKQIKKELYVTFQTAAQLAGEVQQQTRGKIPKEQIVAMVQEHPHIKTEIVNILTKIYQKHGVTESQFEGAATGPYANNQEIKAIRDHLKASYDSACAGQPPQSKTEIPATLTAEKTIEVVRKTMIASAKKLQQVFVEIAEKNNGAFNIQDPNVIKTLNTIKMDDMKESIYNEYGLNDYEDSGAKILQFALQTYQMKDMSFAQRYGALEMKHRTAMDQILTNPQGVDVDSLFSGSGDMGMNMGGFGGQQQGGAGGFNPSRPGARTRVQATEKKEEESNTEKKEENTESKTEEKTNKLSDIKEEVTQEQKQSEDQKETVKETSTEQQKETVKETSTEQQKETVKETTTEQQKPESNQNEENQNKD